MMFARAFLIAALCISNAASFSTVAGVVSVR